MSIPLENLPFLLPGCLALPAQASGWMNSESRQRLDMGHGTNRQTSSKICGSEQRPDPNQQLMVEFLWFFGAFFGHGWLGAQLE